MPDIYLRQGEASTGDVRLRDTTIADGAGGDVAAVGAAAIVFDADSASVLEEACTQSAALVFDADSSSVLEAVGTPSAAMVFAASGSAIEERVASPTAAMVFAGAVVSVKEYVSDGESTLVFTGTGAPVGESFVSSSAGLVSDTDCTMVADLPVSQSAEMTFVGTSTVPFVEGYQWVTGAVALEIQVGGNGRDATAMAPNTVSKHASVAQPRPPSYRRMGGSGQSVAARSSGGSQSGAKQELTRSQSPQYAAPPSAPRAPTAGSAPRPPRAPKPPGRR